MGPAELRVDAATSALGNPGGHFWAGPEAAIGGWPGNRLFQLLLLLRGEIGFPTTRMELVLVSDCVRPLLVVALKKGPHPVAMEADELGRLADRLARAEEPQRVPTASFFRVVAGAVALLQLFCAQVRRQRDLWVACHAYYHTRFDIIAVLIEVEPPRTSAVMRAFPMRRPPCVAVGEKTCATIVGRDSLVRANGD
jgi:hypothetical protein